MTSLMELEEVCVARGGKAVVADVSLTIKAGEVVALLGANGAGKTSLLRACAGLAPRIRGQVRVSSEDPLRMRALKRARALAYLPQNPQSAWPIAVEILVALGRYAYGAAPERLSADDRAAIDKAMSLCRIEDLRARRMDLLSGGEQRRAHLARALAQGAPLLLLDEPSAGLDPGQIHGFEAIVNAHAQTGGAVLFSTHDLGLAARLGHEVLLIGQGRVIAQGVPEVALTPTHVEYAYGVSGLDLFGASKSIVLNQGFTA